MARRVASSLLVVSMILAGCGTSQVSISEGPSADMERGEDFASIPQSLVIGGTNKNDTGGVADNQNFYIAIKRTALGKRWFLSSFLSQQYPANASNIPFFSLDTKVVNFKEQNGKLFVFDVDSTKKFSNQVNPEVIVDAYPVVQNEQFDALPNAADYVLIDPSAGLNKFTAYSDMYSNFGETFSVELMYSKRFNRYTDGMSFDQVFTGYSNVAELSGTFAGPENMFRASGTLTISLRAYKEGEGFDPTPLAGGSEGAYYFSSKPGLVTNTGDVNVNATKWNIYQGIKPIRWVISKNIVDIANTPEFKDYDVVGAMKRAIEQWNEVYGFPVLTAEVATNQVIGDEDANFVMVDDNDSAGFAFANWRDNPNTGEIRAASVYFSSVWFGAALDVGDALSETAAVPSDVSKEKLKRMTEEELQALFDSREKKTLNASKVQLKWGSFERQETCQMNAKDTVAAIKLSHLMKQLQGKAAATTLTKKEIVERFLTHVLTHEIGHTLGLRHNFKGSLKGNVSSSVMDYLTDSDSVDTYKPGSYDAAALAYLHGFSSSKPTDKFCNDSYVEVDAECNRFDDTTDPWHLSVKPWYDLMLTDLDIGPLVFFFGLDNETHAFARGAPTAAIRTEAFDTMMIPARPIDPALLDVDPFYGVWYNALGNYALKASYIYSAETLQSFGLRITTPISSSYDAKTITACSSILLNKDGIRTFSSRLTCISVLETLHTDAAREALRQARTDLEKPENQPKSTDSETIKGSFEAFKAKLNRVIENWVA